ncbi:MAG: MmgE/PrpD family protein, partial [Ostreibacterium sp.]
MKDTILNFIHQDDAQFSDELYTQAKRCLLDLLGVAAGATVNESSQILARHVIAQYGATDSSRSKLLFNDAYVSECGASMYGAGLIDSLDAHDGQVLTKGHVGVAVLPVLLAQQNICQLSGKAFLNALIIGYE